MSEVGAGINHTNPVTLPPELWLYIASFLSEQGLWGLRRLNRIFFCTAMDEKYKRTTINTSRFSFSSRMLVRLKCLPFISNRIQFLGVELDYPLYYLPEEKLLPRVPQYWHAAKRHWVVSHVEFLSSFIKLPDFLCRPYPRRYETEIVTSVFPHLTNVRHLSIKMDSFREPIAPEVDPDLSCLFTAMGTSLGSQIETLVLFGSLRQYSHFANYGPSLPQLKTLKVEMNYDPIPWSWGDRNTLDNLKTIVRGVAHFISNQSSHLETLSIKSKVSIDFSDLFSSIQVLPVLHSLELQLRIWPDQTPVLKPRVEAFLQRHSHILRRLHLFLEYSDHSDRSPDQWMLPCLTESEMAFTQLEEVRLRQMMPSTSLNVVLSFIRRASDTLKDICILDRSLQDHDLIITLNALSRCHHLTRLNLTLDLYAINVKLFDLLSAALPHLRDLEIQIQPDQGVADPIPFELVDDSPFLQDLKTRTYVEWHLESFMVRKDDYAVVLPDEVKALIRKCIPSIQYFPKDTLVPSFDIYPRYTTRMGELLFPQRTEGLLKAINARYNLGP